MECRDYIKRIPEYLAGALKPEDLIIITHHLDHCPSCRRQAESFRELDTLLDSVEFDIPEIDLTSDILGLVKADQANIIQGSKRAKLKRTASLIQDLVAAAAAAIIIFWFSGPAMAQQNVPSYTQEVVKVSNSVGGVFQTYLHFYDSAVQKLSNSIDDIGPGHKKGDE